MPLAMKINPTALWHKNTGLEVPNESVLCLIHMNSQTIECSAG